MMKHYTDAEFGTLGEKLAADYLKKKHYKILEKNYKIQAGEVDIIAATGERIVFVEVKTRGRDPMFPGHTAVTREKQLRLMRAASMYMRLTKCRLSPRFDVIELEIDRGTGKLIRLNHYESAFSQTESYARF